MAALALNLSSWISPSDSSAPTIATEFHLDYDLGPMQHSLATVLLVYVQPIN